MKVALNAKALLSPRTGIAQYVHALATDTRLSIYDVLIPKTLADLSASLREIAVAQQRLADIWEERRAPKSDAPLSVAIHHERRA